ncbi:hypothetical protein V5H98_04945 [Georgenia sp. M64]|uniref:hypothetical protein n=1 Tax=Georgenia sp. M64 TaxID=3120520 RepID=UPI0030E32D0B
MRQNPTTTDTRRLIVEGWKRRAVVFEDHDVAVPATDGLDPEELRHALNGC